MDINVSTVAEVIREEPLFECKKKEDDFLKTEEETAELPSFIISTLKRIVHQYDSQAAIVLFGSRARGDYYQESDWDFIVLTSIEVTESLKESIRRQVLYEIEFKTNQHIATIFHNKEVWEQDYKITNLFKSIAEEGIVV